MSQFSPRLEISKSVGQVKLKMANMATRVNSAGQRVMKDEAEQVRLLAIKYSPKRTGVLEAPGNWVVAAKATGPNRRYTFEVRLRENVIARRSKRGKVVRLRDYARRVHDGRYNLGKGSRAKARALSLPVINSGNSAYVGRLYLTRAANHRRAICRVRILKTIQGVLN